MWDGCYCMQLQLLSHLSDETTHLLKLIEEKLLLPFPSKEVVHRDRVRVCCIIESISRDGLDTP